MMKCILVASVDGGTGKTTVCANLGLALRDMGYKVGFLDLNLSCPNLPLALGHDQPPPVGLATEEEKIVPWNGQGYELFSMDSILRRGSALFYETPNRELMRQVVELVDFSPGLDFLLCDLPRLSPDVILSLWEWMSHMWGVLLVCRPAGLVMEDMEGILSMFEAKRLPLLGVVANMAGAICPCGEVFNPFLSEETPLEDFCHKEGIPLLTRIPLCGERERVKPLFAGLAGTIAGRIPSETAKKVATRDTSTELVKIVESVARCRGRPDRSLYVFAAANRAQEILSQLEGDELSQALRVLRESETALVAEMALHSSDPEGTVGWASIPWELVQPLEPEEEAKRWREDLARELKRWPSVAREISSRLALYMGPEDALSFCFLVHEIPLPQLPPGHPFWQLLGVSSGGEWRRLPGWKRTERLVQVLRDKERRESLHNLLIACLARQWQRGSFLSVSPRRGIPLEPVSGGPDPRSMDWQGYTDLRLTLEEIAQHSPPEQARTGRLWLESQDTGESFRQICLRRGEDPNRAKASLQRFLERVRLNLTH